MALPVSDAARATLGLLTRRQGPEDFPYSLPLSRLLGVAAGLTGALEVIERTNILAPLVAALVQVAVIYGLLGLWLRRLGLFNRLPQTFGALMAVTAVLNLLEWPLVVAPLAWVRAFAAAMAGMPTPTPEDTERVLASLPPPPLLPLFGILALVVWGVAVKTHLLERALQLAFWPAVWRLTGLLFVASLAGLLAGAPFIHEPTAGARATSTGPAGPARSAAVAPAPPRNAT